MKEDEGVREREEEEKRKTSARFREKVNEELRLGELLVISSSC